MIDAAGASTPVTTVGEAESSHVLPYSLPGGRVILYTVRKRSLSWGDEQIVAHTLATGTTKVVLTNGADARYVPTGHVVFLRLGVLMAAPFDVERLVAGTPEAVLDSVSQSLTGGMAEDITGAGQYAFSPTGSLAWIRSSVVPYPDQTLVSVDRRGVVTPLSALKKPYNGIVRVSPDGRRLVVTVQTHTGGSVWVYDLERKTLTPINTDGDSEGAILVASRWSTARIRPALERTPFTRGAAVGSRYNASGARSRPYVPVVIRPVRPSDVSDSERDHHARDGREREGPRRTPVPEFGACLECRVVAGRTVARLHIRILGSRRGVCATVPRPRWALAGLG